MKNLRGTYVHRGDAHRRRTRVKQVTLAIGFFGACAIGRTNPNDAIWRIWPYIGALVVSLLIVAAVPWLSIGFL